MRKTSSPLTTVKDRHVYLHLFREERYTNKSPLTDRRFSESKDTFFFYNHELGKSEKGLNIEKAETETDRKKEKKTGE